MTRVAKCPVVTDRAPTVSHDANQGLSAADAAAVLHREGPNRMPSVHHTPMWRQFAAQLFHFFALMLWVAGGLSMLAGMPQLGVAIFVVIVVNGTFAFVQEFRAEHAAERLNDLLPEHTTVRRDGVSVDIPATGLVRGDLVVLHAGDRVSADMTVVTSESLTVDTSMLSGESVPTETVASDTIFAGCFVTKGEATALVVATGNHTRLASLAALTREGKRPTSPLQHELTRVVRTIALLAVGIGTSFFVLSVLLGGSARHGFLFAVGVTVALVPEGLLPTVTLSLAAAAQEMARRHALVRHLESVETLGSTTFICTDKTGTLTSNQMSAREVWTPSGSTQISGDGYEPSGHVDSTPEARAAAIELATAGVLSSDDLVLCRDGEWVPEGEPLEAALATLALRLGIDVDQVVASSSRARTIAFDAHRRMMTVVIGNTSYTKGAPESILPLCRTVAGADDTVANMTGRGLRVIAVATGVTNAGSPDAECVESDLILLGLVAIEDPPRPGVRDALAACRRAGIRVAMLTGDNARTASAIAREVGLTTGDVEAIAGEDLPDDLEALGELVDQSHGVVLSRVTPEDKLRIAHALQQRHHVVAMTGDGVNDGPALHAADIGIAMGKSGTDVARAAADLVLLDDDFGTIVAAVTLGRVTFANMRRFLTYHLVCNMAELTPFVLWAVSGGRFPLVLGVLQILCFDLGVDVVPALALGVERQGKGNVDTPLGGRHLIDRRVLFRAFVVLGPIESALEILAFLLVLGHGGWHLGDSFPTGHALAEASGAAFATVVFCQIGVAFACRSATQWPGALGWWSNRTLLAGVAIALSLLAALEFFRPAARLLVQAAPPLWGWALALAGLPIMLASDLAHKKLHARRVARQRAWRETNAALTPAEPVA